MAAKYLLTTLGCKVNQYESQQLRELLDSLGLTPTTEGEIPDLAVVNTCAVTASASRKSRQALRRLARNGRTKVVAVGCAASEDAAALRRLPGVSAVFGHDADIAANLHEFVVSLGEFGVSPCEPSPTPCPDGGSGDQFGSKPYGPESHRVEILPPALPIVNTNPTSALRQSRFDGCHWQAIASPIDRRLDRQTNLRGQTVSATNAAPATPHPAADGSLVRRIGAFAGHQRAFLKVQDGCDAFCTYCIIPRLRPTLRWKPIAVAVEEANTLVRSGHREIVLTGIFLGAYGHDTAIRKRFHNGRPKPAGAPSPLATLVDALARVPGLARLRLSSLEPGDVDNALLHVLRSHDCCVPHLHLPLQAGSEDVLRRMNRQYTRPAFLHMIDRVRDALDRPAITTDIIVGFPGETQSDFDETMAVARYAGFAKIHAFPFSPRARTAASRWQRETVHGTVVRERMERLAQLEQQTSLAFRRQFVGTMQRVLVESSRSSGTPDGEAPAIAHGRTDRYFEVHFETPTARPQPRSATPRSWSASPGDLLDVRIDRVTTSRTMGSLSSQSRTESPAAITRLHPAAASLPLPVLP